MRQRLLLSLFLLLSVSISALALGQKTATQPVTGEVLSDKTSFDWLLTPEKSEAFISVSPDGRELVIGNAMVSRTFRLQPSLSTISLLNRMTGEEMLRAASPEGSVTIDGVERPIGGLDGQPERGYLKPEWLEDLTATPGAFQLQGYTEGQLEERIHWARSRWALNKENPTGRTVTFTLAGQAPLEGVTLLLTVAAYDHVPVLSKTLSVVNGTDRTVTLDAFRLEHLAFADIDSPPVGNPDGFILPSIHVESDYHGNGAFSHKESDITTRWVTDPAYTSQRNVHNQTRCILDVMPPIGPDQKIEPGDTLRTFTIWEMPFDSDDRERQGLFQRRFYRTIAPWTTENPIFLHLTSTDPKVVFPGHSDRMTGTMMKYTCGRI